MSIETMETSLPVHVDIDDVEVQDLLAPDDGASCAQEKVDASLPPASYWNLLVTHREYRLFIASYIVTHCGEWFNYVASMSVLASGATELSFSRHVLISLLIVVRLLPNVLIAPLGGVLADTRDLRISMIVLDVAGAVVALSFWLALALQCPSLIYVSTFCQQCLAGLYEPCRSAMVPQMVKDANYLHKATTLSGMAWSTMASIGSSLGGLLVASLGISTCFVLDSLTYLLSAWLLYLIHGSWDEAAVENNSKHHSTSSTCWTQLVGMTLEGIQYMRSSPYGAIIWIKFSGAIMFGASDVMNAAFAEVKDELQSELLGVLFACVGIGALLGPLVSDPCVNMERLVTVQRLCVLSFGVMALGYLGIGASWTFPLLCLSTIIRASGMATAWIDSTLLIQKLMPAAMMGRICAADTSLGILGECISAVYAGVLLDYAHFTANQLAFLQAVVAVILLFIWGIYHIQGGGVQKERRKVPKIELTHSES